MSKTASLTFHSYKQPDQGVKRISEGLTNLLDFRVLRTLMKRFMQGLAAMQERRRQAEELTAYWEAANHDPRVMGDYIAAKARSEMIVSSHLASPILSPSQSNRFIAYF